MFEQAIARPRDFGEWIQDEALERVLREADKGGLLYYKPEAYGDFIADARRVKWPNAFRYSVLLSCLEGFNPSDCMLSDFKELWGLFARSWGCDLRKSGTVFVDCQPLSIDDGEVDDKLLGDLWKAGDEVVAQIRTSVLPERALFNDRLTVDALREKLQFSGTDNQLKCAMLAAGFEPVNRYALDWEFEAHFAPEEEVFLYNEYGERVTPGVI